MPDVPISIIVDVNGHLGDLTIVGDPRDAMLATRIGNAVAVAVLELGAK